MTQRLPTPGGDNGDWGDILNDFLEVAHNPDGTLADNTVGAAQIQSGSSVQSSLNKASSSVQSVNSKDPDGSGNVSLDATDVSALSESTADSRYVQQSSLGTANGIAQLDSNGTLETSQVPSGVVSSSQQALGNLGATSVLTLTSNSTIATGTLTTNCALSVTGLLAGTQVILLFAQNSTGGWTLTINGYSVPIPSTANEAFTVILYSPDGSTLDILPPGFGSSDVQTLSNKRLVRRVVAVTQSATPTIDTDNTDVASITGLAQAITSMTTNLTGTPNDGDMLIIRVTDNGTARAITWGSSFEASGNVALPTTTVTSTMLMVGFAWNAVTTKWRCVAVA